MLSGDGEVGARVGSFGLKDLLLPRLCSVGRVEGDAALCH